MEADALLMLLLTGALSTTLCWRSGAASRDSPLALWLLALCVLAAVIDTQRRPHRRELRPGCGSGLALGTTALPLCLLAAITRPGGPTDAVYSALCVTLACSTLALASYWLMHYVPTAAWRHALLSLTLAGLIAITWIFLHGTFVPSIVCIGWFVTLAVAILRALPGSFSAGEVTAVASMGALLITNTLVQTSHLTLPWTRDVWSLLVPCTHEVFLIAQTGLVVTLLMILLAAPCLMAVRREEVATRGRLPLLSWTLSVTYAWLGLLVACMCYPLLYVQVHRNPFSWLVSFMLEPSRTVGERGYFSMLFASPRLPLLFSSVAFFVLTACGPTGRKQELRARMRRAQESDHNEEEYASLAWGSSGLGKQVPKDLDLPNIIQRKYFHALATGLLLPSYLIDTQWTCLAAAVALALLILREAVRVFHLPPLAESIHVMTAAFVDDRDIGVVVVSPLYLQLGLSLPFWLHSLLAPDSSPLPALAGILTVGVADSAASLVGTYFGRHRWPQSKKTIEGSLGAFLSILLVVGLVHGVSSSLSEFSWPGVLVMAAFSAFLEAATSQFDNLFLPLVAFSISCAFET